NETAHPQRWESMSRQERLQSNKPSISQGFSFRVTLPGACCRNRMGAFFPNNRKPKLLRDGKRIPLKPKVYETLIALITNSGRVLEKEELIKQVWPDTFVEENNLTGNIFALRRAFGEHDYIETIPRRGYRF